MAEPAEVRYAWGEPGEVQRVPGGGGLYGHGVVVLLTAVGPGHGGDPLHPLGPHRHGNGTGQPKLSAVLLGQEGGGSGLHGGLVPGVHRQMAVSQMHARVVLDPDRHGDAGPRIDGEVPGGGAPGAPAGPCDGHAGDLLGDVVGGVGRVPVQGHLRCRTGQPVHRVVLGIAVPVPALEDIARCAVVGGGQLPGVVPHPLRRHGPRLRRGGGHGGFVPGPEVGGVVRILGQRRGGIGVLPDLIHRVVGICVVGAAAPVVKGVALAGRGPKLIDVGSHNGGGDSTLVLVTGAYGERILARGKDRGDHDGLTARAPISRLQYFIY